MTEKEKTTSHWIEFEDERLRDDDVTTSSISTVVIGETDSSHPAKKEVSSSMKYVSLVFLTFQNALVILLMRYVRIREGPMFMSTSAVIMSEFIKFTTCLVIILYLEGSVAGWLRRLHKDIVRQPLDCLKISVPSIIYTLQSNLLYVAVSNLDAATYQISYQLKILTTAVFSVIMLKKHLNRLQWVSLVILIVGVALVQMQPESSKSKTPTSTEQKPWLGLLAVIVSCFMSGFAGVYFEKILKGTPQTVWLRNVQLGMLGTVVGTVTMFFKEGEKVTELGMFYGYDYVVWFVVCLHSFGGLLVAIVVKYADNILKGFATSAAIILSCIASLYFFDFHLSLPFTLGAILVITSIYMYSKFADSSIDIIKDKPVSGNI